MSNSFDPAEYDVLLSSGEQVACALIAGRLKHLGYKARSWMSWQLPIITDGPHSSARISKINNLDYNLITTDVIDEPEKIYGDIKLNLIELKKFF